jgi:NMD protein affecting ribosome stability and mRNA decay
MKKKFCPKCGRETEKFYDKVCKYCFISELSVVKKLPDKLTIRSCKSCGKFFINDKPANSVEEALDFILSELLKEKEIKNATYEIKNGKAKVSVSLKLDDAEKSEEKVLSLVSKTILCKSCSMKSSGYFQTTLQIRAPEKLLGLLQAEIENQIDFLNQFDKLAFISSMEATKNGFDVYIGSKSAASRIAKKMKNKYKANIKVSRKLSGSISGKRVYRDTILIAIGE